jgi:hypothetical protein
MSNMLAPLLARVPIVSSSSLTHITNPPTLYTHTHSNRTRQPHTIHRKTKNQQFLSNCPPTSHPAIPKGLSYTHRCCWGR